METSTIIGILTIVGGAITIIKGAFKLFEYIVKNIINPLSMNITTLESTTRELKSIIDRVRDDISSLDRRLTIAEQGLKSAHKRLDQWVDFLKKTHSDTRIPYRE